MNKNYWEGRTWVYQSDITNGAGGGGNASVTVVPGAGNELEILYGSIFNGDTTSRGCRGYITDDDSNILTYILNGTIGAGDYLMFPNTLDLADNVANTMTTRHILSGTMELVLVVLSLGAADDAAFGLVCRLRGGMPTVTEAGAATPTININKEQVF